MNIPLCHTNGTLVNESSTFSMPGAQKQKPHAAAHEALINSGLQETIVFLQLLNSLLKPDRYRLAVRFQPFQPGDPYDIISQAVKAVTAEVDD